MRLLESIPCVMLIAPPATKGRAVVHRRRPKFGHNVFLSMTLLHVRTNIIIFSYSNARTGSNVDTQLYGLLLQTSLCTVMLAMCQIFLLITASASAQKRRTSVFEADLVRCDPVYDSSGARMISVWVVGMSKKAS
jgi:hypothetical protein